jgi:hypothetical protein
MEFCAKREGVRHEFPSAFYAYHIKGGCRTFFGVTVANDGRIIDDEQNPEAFRSITVAGIFISKDITQGFRVCVWQIAGLIVRST